MTTLRRYCGLAWDGNAPENWAWEYYDGVADDDPDRVLPVDVMVTAALHPGLGRDALRFFADRREDLSAWLDGVPTDVRLNEADVALVAQVADLADEFEGVDISLLSKVLHRKRPHLVPLLDRHIVDHYRPVTGIRRCQEAWPAVVEQVSGETRTDDTWRRLATDLEYEMIAAERPIPTAGVSVLRVLDVAIWMARR